MHTEPVPAHHREIALSLAEEAYTRAFLRHSLLTRYMWRKGFWEQCGGHSTDHAPWPCVTGPSPVNPFCSSKIRLFFQYFK